MPIHDVGYRPWSGKLTAPWTRWWKITEAGVAAALKSRWVRRALLASWIPAVYLASVFFFFEQAMEKPDQEVIDQIHIGAIRDIDWDEVGNQSTAEIARYIRTREVLNRMESLPNSKSVLAAAEEGDPRVMRNRVWSWLLSMFLRYPQGIMTLLIVGLIVPPLIARDVRSRAFLLYYSRPITRIEYLLGKMAIPAVILSLITLVPALGLYIFGLLLSPDLSVIADTWDLPFRAILATGVCVIPVCLLSLLFSSLTQESRFAGFAWFAVWLLGVVVWGVIYGQNQLQLAYAAGGAVPPTFDSQWSLVSIYSTIGRVQSWLFGLETDVASVVPSIVVLALICVISFVWLYRRVSAPVRI